ncbi:hypothetical protein DMUE_1858 [Dictyocoela muelleri]|nr:hypothetical protein DMUE_1858 [Dictyocoela muelleri]
MNNCYYEITHHLFTFDAIEHDGFSRFYSISENTNNEISDIQLYSESSPKNNLFLNIDDDIIKEKQHIKTDDKIVTNDVAIKGIVESLKNLKSKFSVKESLNYPSVRFLSV